MTTNITVTVTTNPETAGYRFIGDNVPEKKPEKKQPVPWTFPETDEEAAKPRPIPTITEIKSCGYITVNGCRVRIFCTDKCYFYSVTDIFRAFGRTYKFLPGFFAYARTPHSDYQFMKWVESVGIIQYVRAHEERQELFAVWDYRSYKKL